jgi:hypothetical protein
MTISRGNTIFFTVLFLVVVLLFTAEVLNDVTNAQPPTPTLGANSFTGTQSVSVTSGSAVVAVTNDPNGRAVHGIGGVGGQFETGTGFILFGRGRGHDRFFVDSAGNTTTRGGLRVDGGVSVGGGEAVAVDAPGVVGGRLQILPSGTVSIGTPNPLPSAKLDVAGDVNVRGSLSVAQGSLSVALEHVHSPDVTVSPQRSGNAVATCPAGKQVIGGGFALSGAVVSTQTLGSTPLTNPDRWSAFVRNEAGSGGADIRVKAIAICARIS